MQDVLLLNADHRPVQVLGWQRAVCLLLDQKVRMVAEYPDRVVRAETLTLGWPAVVSLVAYARVKAGPRLNRRNVLARDGHTCAYCGRSPVDRAGRPDLGVLTLDHVIPRARAVGGRVVLAAGDRVPVSSWENLVTACAPCNHAKADRTPEEAGVTLRVRPRRPTPGDAVRIALSRVHAPPEWADWLPS